MANEITITSKIAATKAGVSIANATYIVPQTMSTTADDMVLQTQTISFAAEEKVALGDVNGASTGDEYFIRLRNMDDTNNCAVKVRTGAATYQQVGLMRPGETWGPVRMQKAAAAAGYEGEIWAQFAVADGLIEVAAVEAGDPAA